MRLSWLSVSASLPGQRVFLAIAFRVRILLTSATFRLYSGADKEAPMATEVFLHNTTSRGNRGQEKKNHYFLIVRFMAYFYQTCTSLQNLYWSALSSETPELQTPLRSSANSFL